MKTAAKKIEYKCMRAPELSGLQGFSKDHIYKGRTFNGLFEVSVEWASHKPTFLLEKKDFDKYFQLVQKKIEEPQEV